MNCPWCRSWFEPRRRDQAYCCTGCSRKADQLAAVRAVKLYRAIYWWALRPDRKQAGVNFGFIWKQVRGWIAEDRAAQRLPPPPLDLEWRERPLTVKGKARAAPEVKL